MSISNNSNLMTLTIYNGMIHTFAVAIDVLTHETTHGVLCYDIVGEGSKRFIHEGFADVFACIKDKNWKLGETVFENGKCIRNIANPNETYT